MTLTIHPHPLVCPPLPHCPILFLESLFYFHVLFYRHDLHKIPQWLQIPLAMRSLLTYLCIILQHLHPIWIIFCYHLEKKGQEKENVISRISENRVYFSRQSKLRTVSSGRRIARESGRQTLLTVLKSGIQSSHSLFLPHKTPLQPSKFYIPPPSADEKSMVE